MEAQYPRCMYHKELPALIVQSLEQEIALGPGWYDEPSCTKKSDRLPVVPAPEPEPEEFQKLSKKLKALSGS